MARRRRGVKPKHIHVCFFFLPVYLCALSGNNPEPLPGSSCLLAAATCAGGSRLLLGSRLFGSLQAEATLGAVRFRLRPRSLTRAVCMSSDCDASGSYLGPLGTRLQHRPRGIGFARSHSSWRLLCTPQPRTLRPRGLRPILYVGTKLYGGRGGGGLL